MEGFKGFDYNPVTGDVSCRDVKYALGETTHQDGDVIVGKSGLHFALDMGTVFDYYPWAGRHRYGSVTTPIATRTYNTFFDCHVRAAEELKVTAWLEGVYTFPCGKNLPDGWCRFQNGFLHAPEGEAAVYEPMDGFAYAFMREGILHAETGPAVTRQHQGKPIKHWFLNGEILTAKAHTRRMNEVQPPRRSTRKHAAAAATGLPQPRAKKQRVRQPSVAGAPVPPQPPSETPLEPGEIATQPQTLVLVDGELQEAEEEAGVVYVPRP
jgi:hypothetical protein